MVLRQHVRWILRRRAEATTGEHYYWTGQYWSDDAADARRYRSRFLLRLGRSTIPEEDAEHVKQNRVYETYTGS